MRDHYTDADRERLGPSMQAVKAAMLGADWLDLDAVAEQTGLRVGTVSSKLRELCDGDHAYLGLAYERRRVGGGVHQYRLFIRKPEQLALLGEAYA